MSNTTGLFVAWPEVVVRDVLTNDDRFNVRVRSSNSGVSREGTIAVAGV